MYKACHFQTISFLLIKLDNSREQHESIAKSALPNLLPFLSEDFNVNKQQWVETVSNTIKRRKLQTIGHIQQKKYIYFLAFLNNSLTT